MEKLFNELKALTEMDGHTFFSSIQTTPEGMIVEIFSYHAEPESSWDLPSARDCRGTMFEIDRDGNPLQILSRPMHKFFNLDENHLSQREDLKDKILYYTEKHDGSLISTYLDKSGTLRLKSKGSLNSNQAIFANRFIQRPEYSSLKSELQKLADNGWTTDLEYVGPHNQIVLGYEKPLLIVLSVRNNETGEYLLPHEIRESSPVLSGFMSEVYALPEKDFDQFIAESQAETGIEGYIFILEEGDRFKVKTEWYFSRHRIKDEISSDKKLIKAIIDGRSDDLKHLFADDPITVRRIRAFENSIAGDQQEIISQSRYILSEIITLGDGPGAQAAHRLANQIDEDRSRLLFAVVMKLRKNPDLQSAIKMIQYDMIKNPDKYVPLLTLDGV